jgi:hypothetical protein
MLKPVISGDNFAIRTVQARHYRTANKFGLQYFLSNTQKVEQALKA